MSNWEKIVRILDNLNRAVEDLRRRVSFIEANAEFSQAMTIVAVIPGPVVTGVFAPRFQLKDDVRFEYAYATLDTAGAGATVIDVLLNGTSMFATTPANRISLGAGVTSADSGTPDTVSGTAGDYLQVETVTAGAGAADPVVHIRCWRR